jgi:hypothetical protein
MDSFSLFSIRHHALLAACVASVIACRPNAQNRDAPVTANPAAIQAPETETAAPQPQAQAPQAPEPTPTPDAPPPAVTPPPTAARSPVPLGVNLSAVNYYASAIPFVDLMKMADPFQSTHAPNSGAPNVWDTELADKIPRDEGGYALELPFVVPGAAAPQILRTSVAAMVYAGHYVVLYDGEGELAFPASSVRIISSAPGRVDLDVPAAADQTLFLAIVRSARGNHVRNIRVLLPGYEQRYAEQVFHPTFLSKLAGIGAVRFMDWGAINGHELGKWSERTRPSTPQGGERGVAYEYMIDLANRLDADPWVCVPHLADDGYVEGLAQLIKARLKPGRKVYIEYSNELWNGIFKQTGWASEQGCKAGLNKLGKYPGGCAEDGPRYWAGIKWNARRTGEIIAIFDRVFAADKARVVRVIAGHAHNEHMNEVLVSALEDKAINRAGTRADVLAIAPYLGGAVAMDIAKQGKAAAVSVPELLDKLESLVRTDVADATRVNHKIAQQHGLRLTAYEGGQHLVVYGDVSSNGAYVDKLIAANRNPRMRTIYARMLDAWYENSGQGLMVLFNFAERPGKYGSWGLLEGQEQPLGQAPKYQAFFDRLQRLSASPSSPK